MTTPTIRIHCAALAIDVDYLLECIRDNSSDPLTLQAIADRANTARDLLAAEPAGEVPTPADYRRWHDAHSEDCNTWSEQPTPPLNLRTTVEALAWAQHCLGRWGRPAAPPAPEVGEAGEVGEGPTAKELLAMRSWSSHGPTFDSDLVDFGRAILARWGRPAAPSAPEVGESSDEAAHCSRWLELEAENALAAGRYFPARMLTGASELLARWGRPATPPAPQSGLPWATDGPAVPGGREPASVAAEAKPLSPAAQKVLDAFWKQPGDRSAIAATLRAVADQVVPEQLGLMHPIARSETHAIRAEILAISAELEGSNG